MMSDQDRAKGQRKDCEKDWQDLARLASQEKDPGRLMELIHRLNSALEENDGRNGRKDERHNPPVPGTLNPPQSGAETAS